MKLLFIILLSAWTTNYNAKTKIPVTVKLFGEVLKIKQGESLCFVNYPYGEYNFTFFNKNGDTISTAKRIINGSLRNGKANMIVRFWHDGINLSYLRITGTYEYKKWVKVKLLQ